MSKHFCALLFCVVACGPATFGQDISGSISGAVLDPTGSAIPNAKIIIKDTDRNQVVRTVTTNDSGVYTAPLIPAGIYSIRVEAAGFKSEDRTHVALNVNDDLKFNFSMQIGATSETIEVTAEASSVELGSAADATTIEGRQITELSLATRNYEQLVALMPGVAPNAVDELYVGTTLPSGAVNTVPFSINGSRSSANNWTVDGADNVDRGSNLTLQTFPSVDGIQQFKVERGLYTADTGRAGGAQINVVTRGGAQKFHGGFYEFFRNDALVANTWNNNANRVNLVNGKAKAPPLRWNDYGGTIGGPIYIPGKFNKERNRTFFFYSQEWRKIITYNTFNPTLPTAGMLAGNFPQNVCVQFNGTTCARTGNQIAASQFNPNSQAYIKDMFGKLPLSAINTTAATTGGFFATRNLLNSRQEMARIDHQFSERFSIWGRFVIDDIPTTEAGGWGGGSNVPGLAVTNTNAPGRVVVIHVLNTITPAMFNDAGFNFSQSAILTTPIGLSARSVSPDINPQLAFPNPEGTVPAVSFSGIQTFSGSGPYNDYNRNYTWFDNLLWIRGRHTLRFGFSLNYYQKTENAHTGQGTFTFTNTGIPSGTTTFQQEWANFLLGNVATFTQPSRDITPDVRAWQSEAFINDDFKLTSHLTVFTGIRWSYFGQPIDTGGLMNNFDPELYNPAKAPAINPANGSVIPGTVGWQTNGIIIGGKNSPFGEKISNNNYVNFAPRFSFAWDPFGNGRTAVRGGYGIFFDSTLFGTYEQNIFANPPFVSSVTYNNANFSNVTGGAAGIDPLSPQGTSVLTLHATQIPAHVPYTQQWKFDIQRRLSKGMFVDLAYVGTRGTHLLGIVDLNEAPPGLALANKLHAAGNNTVFTSTDQARINAVRPYRGFGPINALETGFSSNYHALQLQTNKNFGAAGLIGVSYTFSKTLANASSDRSHWPQNSYDWSAEYGPTSYDRRHILSANYVYTLPFFKRGHGLRQTTIGGWQISGIIQSYSGQPVTIATSGVDPAGLGLLGNTNISNRPDQTCDANAGAAHNYGGAAQASAQKMVWFNTGCFANVPQGLVRPGNEGRFTVRGPGFFNWDASLFKNFSLNRDNRWKLQLRLETFNTLNWVNPSGFSSTTFGATNFGQISSFRAARRIQLGAKINF